ncbi:hypothetical protein HanXRQr2_Chr01g0015091 [Helianthus annuus]|uniref:Uncharacterized protein n=1 Tax=Helianthus annuus TaxID=4232 RepID=A0A9K3JUR7_HELAN|nr:hypothetical protein HanXRQr2_Chr01g0015091 [Helianthus annuus]KAJ0956421.1 hypothetical protein HanPSC8_Chr01g0014621 [Helianthus annuus]
MLYDRAGLDESFGAYASYYQLSPFHLCHCVFYFLFIFSFLSRFPSYVEGNVKFKCGDGN